MNESILSVLQCDGDHDRVVLVHRQSFGNSELLLRRESFSEDVGWFEQSTIELSPGQLGQLKQALAILPASKSRPACLPQPAVQPQAQRAAIAGQVPAGRWAATAEGRQAADQPCRTVASGPAARFSLVSQIAG